MKPRPANRSGVSSSTLASALLITVVGGGSWRGATADGPQRMRVAICDDNPDPAKGPKALQRILVPDAGFTAERITSAQIRDGGLAGFDVLIMPGGSGSKQAERLEKGGREAIRAFVRDGGGYVGICAGSYLASSHYDWSLGLINARVWDRAHWDRGGGEVRLRMSGSGEALLGRGGSVPCHYNQGPLLVPDDEADLPGYEVLATFETEVASKGAQPGSMEGTHAIIRSLYGRGRVICYSPHPEATGGPNDLVAAGVAWAGGGTAGGIPGKESDRERNPAAVTP